jgi:hypothetical protein
MRKNIEISNIIPRDYQLNIVIKLLRKESNSNPETRPVPLATI